MRLLALLGTLICTLSCSPEADTALPELVSAWDEGPSEFSSALESLPADQRWLAIRALLQVRPEASEAPLCSEIPADSRRLCQTYKSRIQERPHLWGAAHQRFNRHQERPRVQGDPRDPSSGPDRSQTAPPKAQRARLRSLPSVEVPCDAQDSQCIITHALQVSDRERGAQICLGATSSWQAECFFRLGESQARGAHQVGDSETLTWAIDYCLAAESFAGECLDQVLIAYWLSSPPASEESPAPWKALLEQTNRLMDSKMDGTGSWRAHFVGKFWAGILHHSFQQVTPVARLNTPIDLPSRDAHIRSAAAFRWVQLKARSPHSWGEDLDDLERWARELLQVLQEETQSPTAIQAFKKIDYSDNWQEDAPGDERFPALSYLGGSRRTWSSTPLVDAQIALLEAFAQHREAGELLKAASAHASPEIAWTAKRLRSAAGFP